MLYWWFHFENEIPINCLFTQWKWTYVYWILDLKGEVHSMWDLWISGLQECKGNGVSEFRRAGGQNFSVGSKRSRFLFGGLPLPESTSPGKFVGRFLTTTNLERLCPKTSRAIGLLHVALTNFILWAWVGIRYLRVRR